MNKALLTGSMPAMRKAFTLIELLVVISIIALLIAILLPVLSRTKESAARIECGANTRSLSQGYHTLSVDNKGRYRLGSSVFGRAGRAKYTYLHDYEEASRVWGGTTPRTFGTNIRWVGRYIFKDLYDTGVTLDTFVCPNRPLDELRIRTFNPTATVPGDQYQQTLANNSFMYLVSSFNVMAGQDQRVINIAGLAERAWVSPMSMEDASELPMIACLLEANNFGGPDGQISTYPHGPKGFIQYTGTVLAKDSQCESEGGNVTANDGSTQFVRTEDSTVFRGDLASSRSGGHWNYVPSYDAVNPGLPAP